MKLREHIDWNEWNNAPSISLPKTKHEDLPMRSRYKSSSHSLHRSKREKRRYYTEDRSSTRQNSRSSKSTKRKDIAGEQRNTYSRNTTSMDTNSTQSSENTNSRTRRLIKRRNYRRRKAHNIFDQTRKTEVDQYRKLLRRQTKHKAFYDIEHPRSVMYKYLAKQMNLTEAQTHFKLFDVKQCKQAIQIAKAYLIWHSPWAKT